MGPGKKAHIDSVFELPNLRAKSFHDESRMPTQVIVATAAGAVRDGRDGLTGGHF
jgi:hypothetical protein